MFWNQGVTSWSVRSASGVRSETGKVVWSSGHGRTLCHPGFSVGGASCKPYKLWKVACSFSG